MNLPGRGRAFSTRRAFGVAWAGLAALLASCSGSNGPPEPTLSSIELSPPSAPILAGASQQFTATGHFSDGGTASVAVTWTATGGTISTTGLYTAGAVAGTYQVVATEQGGSISKAAAGVTITTPPPNLVAVEISPDTLIRLKTGTTFQYSAIGRLGSGGTAPVAVEWTVTTFLPATNPNTIAADGLFLAGRAIGSYLVIATLPGGSLADTVTVHVHGTDGVTVQGPLLWAPSPGAVYLCTSNHFTDDPVGPAGVATVTALPAGGVLLPSDLAYSNGPAVMVGPEGDGGVAVVCQKAWEAPGGLVGTVQVTVDVVSNRPVPAWPRHSSTRNCIATIRRLRTGTVWSGLRGRRLHDSTSFAGSPLDRAPVSATVTVSATDGANIWFKNTYVP